MMELDSVVLTQDFATIPKGTEGVVVYVYDALEGEVEFFDEDGDTIDVVMVPFELLEPLAEWI